MESVLFYPKSDRQETEVVGRCGLLHPKQTANMRIRHNVVSSKGDHRNSFCPTGTMYNGIEVEVGCRLSSMWSVSTLVGNIQTYRSRHRDNFCTWQTPAARLCLFYPQERWLVGSLKRFMTGYFLLLSLSR